LLLRSHYKKSLTKIGNSHSIIIFKEVLHAIGVSKNSQYEIRVTGEGILEVRFQVEAKSLQEKQTKYGIHS